MSAPTPPLRAPHYGDNETYGWPVRQCAMNLIATLSGFVRRPLEFRGSANGRMWHFEGDYSDRASLLFTSDLGDGRIELTVHESNWVQAEVFVRDTLVLRAWVDEPYEEKEFWPDGGDGFTSKEITAPGRISKRGSWLQIECARFPGVPGGDYWSVSDIYY